MIIMNGILLVNKESGLSSNAVIQKIKRILGIKKIGHAGTLDPLATGLLVVLLNEATKLSDYLLNQEKEYLGEVTLGVSTDTEDSAGEVLSEVVISEIPAVDPVLATLLGKQKQHPPMYSAIKKDGKKLYQLARAGKTIEREEREIEVSELTRTGDVILEAGRARFSFRAKVSKGTYIRSLAVEIGRRLGYPAYLSGLTRTKSGNFHLEKATSLADLEAGNYRIIEMLEALSAYPQVEVDPDLKKKVLNGRPLSEQFGGEEIIVFKEQEELLAIYKYSEGKYRAARVWN
jgi:tRNA pseudouridine55 synthase